VKLLLGDLDGETLVESNERRQSCLTMSPGATNTNEKGIASAGRLLLDTQK